jgi:hypothetical protein
LAFIQDVHGLEVLSETIETFEHLLAVGDFLTTNDMLTLLKVLIQIIVALLDVKELVKGAG